MEETDTRAVTPVLATGELLTLLLVLRSILLAARQEHYAAIEAACPLLKRPIDGDQRSVQLSRRRQIVAILQGMADLRGQPTASSNRSCSGNTETASARR